MKTQIQGVLRGSPTPMGLGWDSGSRTLQAYWHRPFLIREEVSVAHGMVSKDLLSQICRTVG